MSTNFERYRVQVAFEQKLGCQDLQKWTSYLDKLRSYHLDEAFLIELKEYSKWDTIDVYYKAISCIADGLLGIAQGRYSWSVIKFYYSVFYLLRCSLSTRGFIFLKNKGIYSLQLRKGESPQKRDTGSVQGVNARGDHVTIIKMQVEEASDSDILQSNTINGNLVYIHLMNLRNRVNYQERSFNEPSNSYFHNDMLEEQKIRQQVEKYLADSNIIYCFDKEHCCLAVPLVLLRIVSQQIQNYYSLKGPVFEEKKQTSLDKMLKANRLQCITSLQPFYSFKE